MDALPHFSHDRHKPDFSAAINRRSRARPNPRLRYANETKL